MNTQRTPSEDPLEVLLHKDHALLADGGFSARVLAALPPPKSKPLQLPSRRFILCSLGGLAGAAYTFFLSGIPNAAEIKAIGTTLLGSAEKLVTFTGDLRTPAIVTTVVAVSFAIAYFREILIKLPKL